MEEQNYKDFLKNKLILNKSYSIYQCMVNFYKTIILKYPNDHEYLFNFIVNDLNLSKENINYQSFLSAKRKLLKNSNISENVKNNINEEKQGKNFSINEISNNQFDKIDNKIDYEFKEDNNVNKNTFSVLDKYKKK